MMRCRIVWMMTTEPSEFHKREIYKLRRNLGHPPPNEFGRVLTHANMKRNCVRWAVKELKCRHVRREPSPLPADLVPCRVACGLIRLLELTWLSSKVEVSTRSHCLLGYRVPDGMRDAGQNQRFYQGCVCPSVDQTLWMDGPPSHRSGT